MNLQVIIPTSDFANNVIAKVSWTTKKVPFLYLSAEIPPPPLFKDEYERNIIPQMPLFTLLKKFDGETIHVSCHVKFVLVYPLTAPGYWRA